MSHPPHEPSVPFDYDTIIDALDGVGLPDVDDSFWALEAELVLDLLRWFVAAKDLASVGARCLTLVLYLRPELIKPASLRQISKLENAPTRAALSKALLDLETKYGLRPSPIQKPAWSRAVFRRSQIASHQERMQ